MRARQGVGIWAVSLALVLGVGRAGAAAEPVRVAILPIVVHSGAPDPGYVSRGIAGMIASRLELDGRVRALQVEDDGLATTRIGEALAAGRERGADFVLFGAFTQFGDGASLDLHCIPVAANEVEAAAARRIFIQSGALGEIIPKLDEIVARVSTYMVGSPPVAAGESPPPAPSPETSSGAAAALSDLAERVQRLEEQVYGGAPPTAAEAGPEEVPGS